MSKMFPLRARWDEDFSDWGFVAELDQMAARKLAQNDARLQGAEITIAPAIDDAPLNCAPGVHLAGEQWP